MRDRSLRTTLLLRFGIGIAVLLALDALACYYTALYFTNLVYDRWLIDSTRSLATAIRITNGKVEFDLQREALDVFRFDETDKTYFKISTAHGGYISGDRALADFGAANRSEVQLGNATIFGQRIREVTMRKQFSAIADDVTVSVAETLIKRARLTQEILFAMVAPQVGLLLIAVVLSWLSIASGLKPLTDLARQLEARDHNNLTPVPLAGLPREARVLVLRINDLLKRISQALQIQKRFVADAAHQLRTPLAAIMLHAERAEHATDAATEKQALQVLHVSVQRAARLSQQLLALARAEPDAAAMEAFTAVNLGRLARQIGEEWIPIALERDIDFGLSVPEQPIMVRGNARLLGELLSSLIDNALQYVQTSGSVTVSVERRDQVYLCVEDDGPGIPASEYSRIFERFYRVPGTSGAGCGLGLAIVKEIVQVHGATITVTPGQQDTGAKFSICFPGDALHA